MMPNVKKGDSVKGKVTGVENYGIFLLMDDGYTGLIHISEISDKFVRNVGDYVQVDDVIYAKVIEVDDENKRYKLTIKNYDYREGKSNDIEDVNNKKGVIKKTKEIQ
jgi:predicted RNA-binding protein with RPS1 domain